MTAEERNEICTKYVQRISLVMTGGQQELVVSIEWKPFEFDSNGKPKARTYAPTTGAYICVSDGFRDYDDGVSSNVNRLIDALTHESYHKYRYEARKYPEAFGAPQSLADEWNEPYLQTNKPHPNDPSRRVTGREYLEQPLEYDARAFASLSA